MMAVASRFRSYNYLTICNIEISFPPAAVDLRAPHSSILVSTFPYFKSWKPVASPSATAYW